MQGGAVFYEFKRRQQSLPREKIAVAGYVEFVPKIAEEVLQDVVIKPTWNTSLLSVLFAGLDSVLQVIFHHSANTQFLEQLNRALKANISQIFSLSNCRRPNNDARSDQGWSDHSHIRIIGDIGRFINNDLWFGLLLGVLLQMLVALSSWETPWTFSTRGGLDDRFHQTTFFCGSVSYA
jgi:hypothetical protein